MPPQKSNWTSKLSFSVHTYGYKCKKWVIYLIAHSDFKLNALKYIMLLHFGLFPAMIQFVTFNTTKQFHMCSFLSSGKFITRFKTKKKLPIGESGMKYVGNKLFGKVVLIP